jgi:hypothetical protein
LKKEKNLPISIPHNDIFNPHCPLYKRNPRALYYSLCTKYERHEEERNGTDAKNSTQQAMWLCSVCPCVGSFFSMLSPSKS